MALAGGLEALAGELEALAGGLEALAGEFTPLSVQRNAIQSKNENIGGVEGRAYCGLAKASSPAAALIHSINSL